MRRRVVRSHRTCAPRPAICRCSAAAACWRIAAPDPISLSLGCGAITRCLRFIHFIISVLASGRAPCPQHGPRRRSGMQRPLLPHLPAGITQVAPRQRSRFSFLSRVDRMAHEHGAADWNRELAYIEQAATWTGERGRGDTPTTLPSNRTLRAGVRVVWVCRPLALADEEGAVKARREGTLALPVTRTPRSRAPCPQGWV